MYVFSFDMSLDANVLGAADEFRSSLSSIKIYPDPPITKIVSCFLILMTRAIIKIIPTKINVNVAPEHTHLDIQKTEARLAFCEEISPSTKY